MKDVSLGYEPISNSLLMFRSPDDSSNNSNTGWIYDFDSDGPQIKTSNGFSGKIDNGFTGITTNPTGNKNINLGIQFTKGLAEPEINKTSGDLIYLDNRPLVTRDARQKEDIKIILEF